MVMKNEERLWKEWNQTKSPLKKQELLRSLDPLIQSEVNKRQGTLQRNLLLTQAKILAAEAIDNFDPNRGVKLNTHVVSQLRKLSRVNTSNQNVFRLPERNALQFHTFMVAKDKLEGEIGRPPTVDELSDELHWSNKRVVQIQNCADRSELLESGDVPAGTFIASTHDPRLGYVYHSMSPLQKKIFAGATGYQGAARKSNPQLMKELGITQGQLSYEKTKIKKLLKDAYV